MASCHGCSDWSNAVTWEEKYAAWAGSSAERAAATAEATAGMVFGSYHKCGFGVELGNASRCCTTMTVRRLFGEADSILLMKLSYPAPFCTTRAAPPISRATVGLDSKVWGSVLGLSSIDFAET